MVYSLRMRLSEVPCPPDLSPRGINVTCSPLQGCTNPPGLQCKCFTLANPLDDVPSPVPNPFPQDLQVPQLASEKGKEGKPEVPTKAG